MEHDRSRELPVVTTMLLWIIRRCPLSIDESVVIGDVDSATANISYSDPCIGLGFNLK